MDPDGAIRYPVKYASAGRWQPSALAKAWGLPNGGSDVTALPMACPQPGLEESAYSEDCLSLVLYVPESFKPGFSNKPVLVWLHGGSFMAGSATGPGLDGSKLALATDSIVAVVQYRLGALGFLAPNGNTNLGVKDVVVALQFLRKHIAAFGGSSSKITLAGQSSGAHMIRTLLAAPSASSLFRSAILQSDPINYGFLRPNNHANLLNAFMNATGCSSSSCPAPLSAILSATEGIAENPLAIDPALGVGEPIRPVYDGAFITAPLEPGVAFPSSVTKPLLLTSVQDDGAGAIYEVSPEPIPATFYPAVLGFTLGAERAALVAQAPYYTIPPSAIDDVRPYLGALATDYLYRCSGWSFAREYAAKGGQVYVGEFALGAPYPGNEDFSVCTAPGVVCHQDDIQIVFGTVPNPSPVQAALVREVQGRYKAFLGSSNPNAAGLATWKPATKSDVRAIKLGASGTVPVGACDPSFWGASVEFDYQLFN